MCRVEFDWMHAAHSFRFFFTVHESLGNYKRNLLHSLIIGKIFKYLGDTTSKSIGCETRKVLYQ